MSNLSSFIGYHARRNPDRTALVFADERVSYAALWDRIQTVAALLRLNGVARDDRVALLMKNSDAFIEISFAVSHVGAVLVPINFRLNAPEVDYILEDSGAVLLLRDEEFATWTPQISTIDVPQSAQCDATRLGSSAIGNDADRAMAPVRHEDLMRIMYTSGTTDRPKGVMHSYRNFYAKSADHIVELELTAETRLLVAGPLYHVGAFDLPGIGVLWAGGMLCIQRDFDAPGALDLIERERLTASWLAPVMTGGLIACQNMAPRDVSSLQWTIGGGERTPESRILAYAAAFPNARYIDAYGLTETCGGDTFMERGREIEKIGSVGRPVALAEIEIRDESGRVLRQGEEGEICVRGPKVTRGYWQADEKTAASFHGDWLRTGDAGYLDADGFLFLTDRMKDMIISGGENIASAEVERVISQLPAIQDVAVIGCPDERWGERPVAFIVLAPGHSLDENAVRNHCRAGLAAFKVPDRVHFRSELPRNASGKILKRDLRQWLIGN